MDRMNLALIKRVCPQWLSLDADNAVKILTDVERTYGCQEVCTEYTVLKYEAA